MTTLNSRIRHAKIVEIVLGLLIVFLTIISAGAIYQIKILNSDQAKYNAKAKHTLMDANLKFLYAVQNINLDRIYYDQYSLNQNKSKLSRYYKSNFSSQLTAAIIRSGEKPFNQSYYDDMYRDAYQTLHDTEKSVEIAKQYNQRGNMFQLILIIASVCSTIIALIASQFDDKKKLRLFKSIPFPPSFPPF